jgi:hypothetical protein
MADVESEIENKAREKAAWLRRQRRRRRRRRVEDVVSGNGSLLIMT